MLLIGVNRSPYTRRVAITLHAYGVAFEQKAINASSIALRYGYRIRWAVSPHSYSTAPRCSSIPLPSSITSMKCTAANAR